MARPASWRDVPASDPTRGAQLNGYGLGAWRSVVPAPPSSRASRSAARSGRGQPNDLERAIADRALARKDKGLNPLNLGGKLLLGALDALDTPRAAVAAGVSEALDAGLGIDNASFDDWLAKTRGNISMGEATGLSQLARQSGNFSEKAGAIGAGFALDVLVDPLTYVGGVAAKVGEEAGAPAARKFLEQGTKDFLGEQAAKAFERGGGTFADAGKRAEFISEQGDVLGARAAQQALKYRSNQMLNELEREAIGAEPGTYVRTPFKIDKLVEKVAPSRMREGLEGPVFKVTDKEAGLGRLAGKLRRRVTAGPEAAAGERGFGNKIAELFASEPEMRKKILFGTPEEAATAFTTMEKGAAGRIKRRLFDTMWGERLSGLLTRAKKAGINGEDLRYAVAEQMGGEVAGPSLARVVAQASKKGDATLAEDLQKFFPDIAEAANSVDPELPWLRIQGDYTTRTPSDEMIALRGGRGGGGAMRKETFDKARTYGLGEGMKDELLGEKLLPPAQANGRSIERQIDDILTAHGQPNLFEKDAYKAFPDYVRRLSKRYGDEWTAKQLRDLGIFEASWVKQATEKGMSQGKVKAFLYEMNTRAVIRAQKARVAASEAAVQAQEATRAAKTTEGAIGILKGARGDLEAEGRRLEGALSTTDAAAVREYETHIRENAASLGVKRQELLDQVAIAEDAKFGLDHAHVELAHRIQMETYRSTEKVTRLEAKLGELRNELSEVFDRAAQVDAGVAGEAIGLHTANEARATEIMGQMRAIDDLLHQFEDLATMPTEHLEQQLVDIDGQLGPALRDYMNAPEPNEDLARKIQSLGDLKASVLHEKGVIERARGRIEEIDRSNPAALIAEMDDLRNAEDMGDKMIHALFPEMPEDISGYRIREYFTDRMGELQQHIDDTQGQVMSAYADRDSMRVQLAGIRQQRREAERNLRKVVKETSPKEYDLWWQQNMMLKEADDLTNRAIEIEAEHAEIRNQMGFNAKAIEETDYSIRVAEGWLASQRARQLKYEATALQAEADSATARKVQKIWEDIGRKEMSKPQETAMVSALNDNFHEVGAVSMTKHEWLAEALKAKTIMSGPEGIRPALRAYDKVLNLWKAYALATPGTIMRNLYGGVFNNWLAGNVEVADYAKVLRHLNEDTRGVRHVVGKLSAEDEAIMAQMHDAGIFVGGGTATEIEHRVGAKSLNPVSPDFRGVWFFRKNQERAEELLRGTLAYSTLRQGGTMDDAIARIVKYHFDYEDLNKFERSVMRRVVPFYTWTRKNFPLMLEQIVQKPTKFSRYYQLRNEIQAVSPEESVVPAYFGENLGIRLPFSLGKGVAYDMPDLPFTSLNDTTDPSMIFSQASPFIKTPIEYAFGKQVFKGIPLKDEYQPVPKFMEAVPGLFQGLQALGKAQRGADGQWMMKQKDMYAVEQFLPSYGKARRLFPSEQQYDERTMSSWINAVFGVGVRSNTPTERRNESARRVVAEMERLQTAKERGFITDEDKMPRFGQTVNAAYQQAGVPR